MAVPKRRSSKSKIRMRKASHKRPVAVSQPCAKCGGAQQPHRVCPACGSYKGRQVVTPEAE